MTAGAALYLDTSVALRATLEQGTTPALEQRIAAAPVLVTSRLSLSNRHARCFGCASTVVLRRAGWPT